MPLTLKKEDLRWAHWRMIPAEPRPKAKPFSFADSLRVLQALPFAKKYPYKPIWSKLKLSIAMSREEAHFWIEAMVNASENRVIPMEELIKSLSHDEAHYTGNLSLEQLLANSARHLNAENHIPMAHIIPAFVLLNSHEFVQFLKERVKLYYDGKLIEEVFRSHLLPYLREEEKASFRESIHPHLQAFLSSPNPPYEVALFGIAGLIGGMDEPLEAYLDSYEKSGFRHVFRYHDYLLYSAFGLSSREKVEAQIRGKKLVVYRAFAKAWLAHTELDGLDWLAYSIPNLRYTAVKNDVFKLLKGLLCAESVLPILSLWQENNPESESRKWLLENPQLVAETLAPLAFSNHPQAAQIQTYLRNVHAKYAASTLEAALSKVDTASQARFCSEILEKNLGNP